MYTATLNGEVFFDTNSLDNSLALTNATLQIALNTAGTFNFTVPPSNKAYGHFEMLTSYVDVYRDNQQLFVGRVSAMKLNFDGLLEVEAEGLLAMLNDTIVRPYDSNGPEAWYHGPQKFTHVSYPDLIAYYLGKHNEYYQTVETEKQIQLGNVDSILYSLYITLEYDNFATTYERIKELVEKNRSYDAFLFIRRTNGQLYLDWTNHGDSPSVPYSEQTIDLGNNLLDLDIERLFDEGGVTGIIPLGAEVENSVTGRRVRITVYDVNDQKDTVELPFAQQRVIGTRVWEDIDDPNELLNEAERYVFGGQGYPYKTNINLTAVDLADAGYDISRFELGTNIYVTSKPHGIDHQYFICQSMSLNLLVPDDNKLTLGSEHFNTYTFSALKDHNTTVEKIEHINSNYSTNERLNDIKTELSQEIQENSTAIEQTTTDISLISTSVNTLGDRVTTAEGKIDVNASNIDLKVDKTDYTAAEIALKINNAGSTIKIQADHINLNGAVTANDYFKINADGSVSIKGGTINVTTASATTNVIQLNYNTAFTKMFPGGMNLRSVPVGGSVSYYDLIFNSSGGSGMNIVTNAGRTPIEIQAYENVGYIAVAGTSADRIISLNGNDGMVTCRSVSAANTSGVTRVIVNGAGGQIVFRNDSGTNTGTINGTNYSGTAAVASKLGSSTVGSSNKPIYLSSGEATAITNVMAGTATDTDARYAGAENKYNNIFCRVLGSSASTKYAGLYQFAEGDVSTAHWLASIQPDGTAWFASTSDRRVKNVIGSYSDEEAVDTLSIPVSLYSYKEDKSKRSQIGVFAQDLRDVQKRYGYRTTLIINDKEGNFLDDISTPEEDILYGIDYTKFVPILIKGWQMHEARIRELELKISKLEGGKS